MDRESAWIVNDGTDRDEWHKAHWLNISASQISKAMTPSGRRNFISNYLTPRHVDDGQDIYMSHGSRREEMFLGPYMEKRYGIPHNKALFGHPLRRRHVATPDGWDPERRVTGEIKTATKPCPRTIPIEYRWQMQWQMYVMGAERGLLVWEHHSEFVPVNPEPEVRWVERDEEAIFKMVTVANALLFEIDLELAA
jgi:hypothetical protein